MAEPTQRITDAQETRIRGVAGATLVVIGLLWLALAARIFVESPYLGPLFGGLMILLFAIPTLYAGISVRAYGRRSGILAGVLGGCYVAFVAMSIGFDAGPIWFAFAGASIAYLLAAFGCYLLPG